MSSSASSESSTAAAATASSWPRLSEQRAEAARRGDASLLRELLGMEPVEQASAARAPAVQHTINVGGPEIAAANVQMGIQNDPRHTGATQPRARGYTGAGGNDQVLDRYDQADLDGESDLLHVTAGNGDGGNYRECATVITQKNITLLFRRNNKNETALDCAVKANHINMALHLLDLERNRSVRPINMNEILQKTNGRSETALHEAVRKRDKSRIQVLKDQDSGLAHVLDVNGISPLYLAVSFGYGDIVDELILTFGNALSYDGPNGQNVLHAAALRGEDFTQKIIENIRENLRNEVDWSGSTPLHFAASVGLKGVTARLLARDTTGIERADNKGMFPVHIAASVGAIDAINSLVSTNPGRATLRDEAKGRTLLHIAIENRKCNVVKMVCKSLSFKDTLNMKDNDGNTALHLAVKIRDESIFRYLLGNKAVELNHVNGEGYTPLDLAKNIKMEYRFASRQNPTEWMIRALAHSGAHFSPHRRDERIRASKSEEKEAHGKNLSQSTESVLVASALIATLTFAAAFTMPGSYRTGSPKEGSPALGAYYGFKVFLVADIFAFFFAVAATFSLAEYGNRGTVDPLVRCVYARLSVGLFHVALKSVIIAFAFGVLVVMWGVSINTIVIVGLATIVLVFYGNVPLRHDFRLLWLMYNRFGFSRRWDLYSSTSSHLDWTSRRLRSFSATLAWNLVKLLWTYILIFVLAYFAQLKQKS